MSNAKMPKAATIDPEPSRLQTVMVCTAPPKTISDMNTSTIVSKLPTEVTTGPHRPSKI